MSSIKQSCKNYIMSLDQKAVLSTIYDSDKVLQTTLDELIPGFEYQNHSHKTIGQIRRELKSRKGVK